MMRLVLFIGLVALPLAAASAADSGVTAYATLDPPEIPFHRQARYTLVVEMPAETEVKLPDMTGHFGGLTVADIRRETQPAGKKRLRIAETYVLEAIFAGPYRIEPATITLSTGETLTIPSPALRVRDLTEEEKAAAMEFAPIAGPLSPPNLLWNRGPWAVAAALAALGCAGAAGYLYWRWRRAPEAAPPTPAWEVAYRRLQALDQRQLPKAGKYEAYYVDLSAILRYYIEDRFLLHAPEQTTPEFLAAAAVSGRLTPEHHRLLAGFLRHCDRVKFAQYVPSVVEMEQSFTTVLQFVDETVPRPDPALEEQAA